MIMSPYKMYMNDMDLKIKFRSDNSPALLLA